MIECDWKDNANVCKQKVEQQNNKVMGFITTCLHVTNNCIETFNKYLTNKPSFGFHHTQRDKTGLWVVEK